MRTNIMATALAASILGGSFSAFAGVGQIGSGAVEVKSCSIHFSNYGAYAPPAPILQLLSQKGYYPVIKPFEGTLILKIQSVDEVFTGYKYSNLGEQFFKTYAIVHALNLFGEQKIGDFQTNVKYASIKQSTSDAISAKNKVCDEYLCQTPESLLNMIQQLPNCNNNVLVPVPAQQRQNTSSEVFDTSRIP